MRSTSLIANRLLRNADSSEALLANRRSGKSGFFQKREMFSEQLGSVATSPCGESGNAHPLPVDHVVTTAHHSLSRAT